SDGVVEVDVRGVGGVVVADTRDGPLVDAHGRVAPRRGQLLAEWEADDVDWHRFRHGHLVRGVEWGREVGHFADAVNADDGEVVVAVGRDHLAAADELLALPAVKDDLVLRVPDGGDSGLAPLDDDVNGGEHQAGGVVHAEHNAGPGRAICGGMNLDEGGGGLQFGK